MSVNLCGDTHISALAAYAVSHDRFDPIPIKSKALALQDPNALRDEHARAIAETLYLANVASWNARYEGRYADEVAPFQFDARQMSRSFDRVALLKSAACFAYQACECPEWEATEAHAIVVAIERRAIQELPGYDAAEWGAP